MSMKSEFGEDWSSNIPEKDIERLIEKIKVYEENFISKERAQYLQAKSSAVSLERIQELMKTIDKLEDKIVELEAPKSCEHLGINNTTNKCIYCGVIIMNTNQRKNNDRHN